MADATDKTERVPAPSVAIDGAKIRSVRETKRLTQLYVANVVGVTTDTISRWENNRYPSIKRENAQKLADALEVALEEILRQEPPGSDADREPPAATPAPASRRLVLFLLFAGTLTLLVAIAIFFRHPPTAPVAVRWTPRFAAPGEIIPVQIKVNRQAAHPFGFILKEQLPDRVRLVAALPSSSASESTGSHVKWLVPAGGAPVTISYSLQIPEQQASGNEVKVRVKGEIVLHGDGANRTEPVGGASEIRIGAYHWADSNGDGRIDDDEIMPAYYICDEMKEFGLEWKTIEAIWSGKGYRWDARNGYTVVR